MEIFISIDVETTGLHPYNSSMISLGAIAFSENGEYLNSFDVNIKERKWWLPTFLRPRNLETMVWWKTQPIAWEIATRWPQSMKIAMMNFRWWLLTMEKLVKEKYEVKKVKLVFVAYPAGFDWPFVQDYLARTTRGSKLDFPFDFYCLDIKSYAMAMLGITFSESRKRKYPKKYQSVNYQQHSAVADALEQGHMFMKMYKEVMGNEN